MDLLLVLCVHYNRKCILLIILRKSHCVLWIQHWIKLTQGEVPIRARTPCAVAETFNATLPCFIRIIALPYLTVGNIEIEFSSIMWTVGEKSFHSSSYDSLWGCVSYYFSFSTYTLQEKAASVPNSLQMLIVICIYYNVVGTWNQYLGEFNITQGVEWGHQLFPCYSELYSFNFVLLVLREQYTTYLTYAANVCSLPPPGKLS